MVQKKLLAKLADFKIDGVGLGIYVILAIIMVVTIALKILPNDIFGALFVMIIMGNIFYWLGANLPIFKTYLGGGAVFALFAPALLSIAGIIPASVTKTVDSFITSTGFVDFFIISLIVGAILGMNRTMLLKASVRFLPVVFISMAVTFVVIGLVSTLIGKGFKYGSLYVAFPIMGGGIGAGAIPLSKIYHQGLGGSTDYLSLILPAVILGNVFFHYCCWTD